MKEMITQENKALELAENLAKQFAGKFKTQIAQNRKNGDTLGVTKGIPIHEQLDAVREQYLAQVKPAITRTTNYFNIAIVRYVLGRKC